MTWESILEPHGWTFVGESEGRKLWRRPGKPHGTSATTGHCSSDGVDLLAVFSSSAHPFPGPSAGRLCSCHSKFDAYTLLNFGEKQHSAAARSLAAEGFGKPSNGQTNGTAHADAEPEQKPDTIATLEPVVMSKLERLNVDREEIVEGLLMGKSLNLISAYAKCGKTTTLSHVIRSVSIGDLFAGLKCKQTKILIITEESSDLWCDRRDALGLNDDIAVIVNPFFAMPTHGEWKELVRRIIELVERDGYGLVIIDTLPSVWPVANENDAAEVKSAILPLRKLAEKACVSLVAHLKKGDSMEGTGTRGSGALMAAVDCIIELRRSDPSNIEDPRRELTILGRWATPNKITIELDAFGSGFRRVDAVAERDDAKNARQRAKREEQAQRDRDDEGKVLEAIRAIVAAGDESTQRQIYLAAGISQPRTEAALFRLKTQWPPLVKTKELPPQKGKFGSRTVYLIFCSEDSTCPT